MKGKSAILQRIGSCGGYTRLRPERKLVEEESELIKS